MIKLLKLAALVAVHDDRRTFQIGAVGVRSDGVIVSSRNGSFFTTDDKYLIPAAHAEARCVRKMDKNGIIYVARISNSGELRLAKPCPDCMAVMRSRKIRRVCYTISNHEYGVVYP